MYVVGSSFFWTMVVYYFFFRVPGREITWKDFVNSYLSKGVVSSQGNQNDKSACCFPTYACIRLAVE